MLPTLLAMMMRNQEGILAVLTKDMSMAKVTRTISTRAILACTVIEWLVKGQVEYVQIERMGSSTDDRSSVYRVTLGDEGDLICGESENDLTEAVYEALCELHKHHEKEAALVNAQIQRWVEQEKKS